MFSEKLEMFWVVWWNMVKSIRDIYDLLMPVGRYKQVSQNRKPVLTHGQYHSIFSLDNWFWIWEPCDTKLISLNKWHSVCNAWHTIVTTLRDKTDICCSIPKWFTILDNFSHTICILEFLCQLYNSLAKCAECNIIMTGFPLFDIIRLPVYCLVTVKISGIDSIKC